MKRDKGYDPYNSAPKRSFTLDFETFASEHTANRALSDTARAKLLTRGAAHEYVANPNVRFLAGSVFDHAAEYKRKP